MAGLRPQGEEMKTKGWRVCLNTPSLASRMTLKQWSEIYCYNPCYHKVGDEIVAFPCSTQTQEWGFWNLSDYGVRSISGGAIWLYRKE